MKETVKKIPLIGPIARRIYRTFKPLKPFDNSASYWEDRYQSGGTSGPGSYGKLAEYKADIVNIFVEKQGIHTVIEHGCGDGNQLKLARYKSYVGYDVSPKSVAMCRELFKTDSTKKFKTNDEYAGEKADLALSLDVIFHLVEDDVYEAYMKRLFGSSDRFVVIYSSNRDTAAMRHERHHHFTAFVERHFPEWELIEHIPNKYAFDGDANKGSLSDFYIYKHSQK